MLTKTGRRWFLAAGLLFAASLAMPSSAQAQGLLPNLPTRYREKPSCAAEPPFYSTVRHQFFGYYPTCWRRFPPGWTCPCPNPELPNFQADLQRKKLRLDDNPPSDDEAGAGNGAGNAPGGEVPPPDEMTPPDLPRGNSPFDTPDANPKPVTPPPLGGDDLLDSERPKAPARPAAAPPSTSAVTEPAPRIAAAVPEPTPVPVSRMDLPPVAAAAPEIAPLVEANPSAIVAAEPALDAAPATPATADEAQPFPPLTAAETAAASPMPATPEPSIPQGLAVNNGSVDPAIPPPPIVQGTTAPATAPRRSVIGAMFNRLRRR